ncbi:MAG: PQQ-dependent sugar dehydrogenase [Coriobacteriia bacterium]|nr:PQQ-dependent sugar dehydrogenase [Coriobacteriia bacterium]
MDTTLARHVLAIPLVCALAVAGTLAGCVDSTTAPESAAPETQTTAPEPEAEAEDPGTGEPLALDELEIELEPVLDGFGQPLFVTGAGDGSGRLFVVEKTGLVWTVRGGMREEVFLDLTDRVSTESEQGLLGIAFSPTFAEDSTVFVSYTQQDGASALSRFIVDGETVDRASEKMLLHVAQPFANHNGGMIAFGPDGYLYLGLGDGGSGGDPYGSGQNGRTLLGKMLRIDVIGGAGDPAGYVVPDDNPFVGQSDTKPEIWAIGLRNPWRFSFDRATGDLWIGDVGQNAWEEIDLQAADSPGGENYGWNRFEASHPYPPDSTAPDPTGFTMPIVEYDRDAGTSVTGGYVYRGTAEPGLYGTYLYADFTVGRIWGLQRAEDGSVQTRELLDTDMMISSFGEDDDGELYVVDFNGAVYRIVAK